MKPPYEVPTLEQVYASPLNGLVVASTFSGGGGSCTGYRMAGYRVAWANEFEPTAAATYARNHPQTVLDTRDIRTITGDEILAAIGLERGELDLFDGSPPCQSFSTAGQRERSWGRTMEHVDGTSQRSDDLFFEYARLLGEMQPRSFVAENVAGMTVGVAKGYFKEIVAALRAQGYVVSSRLIDASWLGVPQARKRVIIVGMRADLGLKPAFPSPLPYRYSVEDACPWIIRQGHSLDLNEWKAMGRVVERAMMPADRPSPTISALAPNLLDNDDGTKRAPGGMGAVGIVEARVGGASRPRLTARLWGKERDLFDVGHPSPTIIASGATQNRFLLEYDTEVRRLTIDEVKRLCSFPDDYVLEGSYEQQWMRLGNSVPPLMTKAVADALTPLLTSL